MPGRTAWGGRAILQGLGEIVLHLSFQGVSIGAIEKLLLLLLLLLGHHSTWAARAAHRLHIAGHGREVVSMQIGVVKQVLMEGVKGCCFGR